jgi:membrane protein
MSIRSRVSTYFRLLKTAAEEFSADNATKLAASLAYYTIFSIGPMLLVIISLTGLFVEREVVTTEITEQLKEFLGSSGAEFVLQVIANMQTQGNAATFSIIGFVVLIFGASGVFIEIQSSINYIWSIRAKPKKGWLKFVTNRLLSFSLIVGIGFLMVVTLFVNTLVDLFTARLQEFIGGNNVILIKAINLGFLFLVISFLFAVVYKVLPDAYISWKDALVGSSFTGFLFLAGKFVIGIYLTYSNVGSAYGAAASVIVLLTWVYYSSMILYYGAEFTKVYTINIGKSIKPYDTAVYIVKHETREIPPSVLLEEQEAAAQKEKGEG